MTLESKENYPRHTKIVQNSLGFMPEVKPLHKPRGDLVLCALYALCIRKACVLSTEDSTSIYTIKRALMESSAGSLIRLPSLNMSMNDMNPPWQ